MFQGNNVRDENADVALFAELGSAPATMEAGKAVDAYGCQPGFTIEQNDGVQAYTQALMKGTDTWVELPPDRWPKAWVGKYKRPVVKLRIALYGHPDSGGLWEIHCESQLLAVGFVMPDPEGWPSVFYHPDLKLLMVVYVDDFKMSGPKESMKKGWELVASRIDMDTPGMVSRYLGCDHQLDYNVKLKVEDHPFAHLFDKSLPDPAAKQAAAAHRTQDYWHYDEKNDVYVRHHVQPRKKLFTPEPEVFSACALSPFRCTVIDASQPGGEAFENWDEFKGSRGDNYNNNQNSLWTGETYLFPTSCKDPKVAMAGVKRDKNEAKKKARLDGFSYMDQLFNDQPCMKKNVNMMTYDMKPFLQSCIDRYVTLAGRDAKPLKIVSTPFYEERIARPTLDEKENKGVLAPIAARVLMKILFAARIARYDLLRAVQGLAARVTKWSTDCDKALYRLICYIHSTLDVKLQSFIGDKITECKLWCFADADHAGEYDNRSTSGCILILVGPNTYFPLTAFSNKQTSVSMSSTEAEVVSANVSLRAVGLPSSGLWAYLQNAGGVKSTPGGLPDHDIDTKQNKNDDYWLFERSRKVLSRIHVKKRCHLYIPEFENCPIPEKRLGTSRTTIIKSEDMVDLKQDNWKSKGDKVTSVEWTGRTMFRVYGPHEADYHVEASEIREAMTDWDFIGKEREGDGLMGLIAPKSIQGVFIEDNQATIRILENGKSPTFRHSDKTQRVNLSWLSEQFKRKWYRIVHGPSMMQAADIFTKPFVSAEKWNFAIKLLSIRKASPPHANAKAATAAETLCTGGPAASRSSGTQRLIVEVCCHPTSKLSDTSRKSSNDCTVLQFTEEYDLNDESNQSDMAEKVNSHDGDTALFWISLPCTGGTTWTYVNMKHPSARLKVMKRVKEFKTLWKSLENFLNMINVPFHVALEWPRGCRYWKLPMVQRVLAKYGMKLYDFDGCAVGLKSTSGIPIRKPWTVATNHEKLGARLSQFRCKCTVKHYPGRGEDLKRTEEYTFRMTDAIHQVLRKHPVAACLPQNIRVCCAIPTSFFSVSMAATQDIIKSFPAEELPKIAERVAQWEEKIKQFRSSCAQVTWDDPVAFMLQHDGYRMPLADLVAPTIGGGNCSGSYGNLVEQFQGTPDGYLHLVECPPGGEAYDVLMVADSSFALVKGHDSGNPTRFIVTELCHPTARVREYHGRLFWGKGLPQIIEGITAGLDEIEDQCRKDGKPIKPVIVMVGWAGNDVWGQRGYKGATWIHKASFNKTVADREVTAQWCDKQRAKVDSSIEQLGNLKQTDPRIADIVMISNADAEDYNLPPAYNAAMKEQLDVLRDRFEIQAVDPTTMTLRTERYDALHMADNPTNRKHAITLITGAAEAHIGYLELIALDDQLRKLPRLERAECIQYPSLAAIKNAIARELKGAVPVQLNVNPSKGDAFNDAVADEEILQWLLQAEEDCSASADREVSPDVPFQGEEVILEAFDAGIVDSDDEDLTCQAISAEAREEAQAKGLSTEEDNEWTKLSFEDAKPAEPDISEWEDTAGKVGVVYDEAPPETKKGIQEVDLDDVVTESSMEVIEEGDDEEFVDAEEGTAEKDVEMGDDARGDPMPESMFSVVTDPGDPRSIANPKAVPEKKKEEEKPDPRSATNPKVMPEKKVQVKKKPAKEPKEKKIEANREVEPGTPRPDVPLKQLDPKTFMNAQDRVWLEPDNMAGVRLVRTDYGRYLAISKVMTAYLRGWKKVPRQAFS